jgi:hypothetical protein
MVTDWDLVEPSSWNRGQPFGGELVERGAGATDTLVYKVQRVLNCSSVNPTTFEITNYVMVANPAGFGEQPLGEGALAETTSGAEASFTVGDDKVTWTVGKPQPAYGTVYAIKYSAIFSYIAFVIPQDRYDNGDNLGQRVLLRPRHVAIQKRATT